MPQSMHGPGSHVAPAEQSGSAGNMDTTDPNGRTGEDTDALIRALGVTAGYKLDGRYRLDRVLHPTGPALTWLATDEKLNRLTRAHIMRSDEPRAQAFMEAARAAAAMPDNHFVQVLDAVPDEGLYYVISEWLHDGRTLSKVLAEGPLPVAEAVRISIELARAMAEAHEGGLAHLRLSPKTVLRTDTGEVKILDLCLAAALTGTVSRDPLGTDLTAIGELAYAMLTGRRPQAQPAPPSQFRPEVTPQLDEAILRTLGDPSAGESYRTPTEVAEALSKLPRPRYTDNLPSTAQTAPLRHQQTQVMPLDQRPPQFGPPPQRPEPRQESRQEPRQERRPEPRPAPSSSGAGGGHGGSHRPAPVRSYADDDDYAFGGRDGGNGKNLKLGIGAVAGVAAVAVLAWSLMSHGTGAKPSTTGTAGGTGAPTTSGTTTGAVGGPISVHAATVYDADNGTEGQSGIASLAAGGPGKWSTSSYCQNFGTQNNKKKPGTGIIFDIGTATPIGTATVGILTAGADVEMWTGDTAPTVKAGATPDGFKKVASTTTSATSFDLKPDNAVTARYVLIWFTTLPAENPSHPLKCAAGDGHSSFGDSIVSVKFAGP